MRTGRIFCLVLCLLCILNGCALASTVRGDLSERFSDASDIEYNGVAYGLRNRLTTMLFMGVVPGGEAEMGIVEYMAVLVTDDDAKTINLIELDCDTACAASDGQGSEPLRAFYTRGVDADEGCRLVLAALNGLLPGEGLIENYLALEMSGLELIDGLTMEDMDQTDLGASFKSRLKVIKADVEQRPSSEWNELFATLSDYITTDMKSGALVKIADKAERYEVYTDVEFAGALQPDWNDVEMFWIDEESLMETSIDIFYEEKKW